MCVHVAMQVQLLTHTSTTTCRVGRFVFLTLFLLQDHHGSQNLNPFKRDFRKSIFRDGAVVSHWMERVHEYGIEVRVDHLIDTQTQVLSLPLIDPPSSPFPLPPSPPSLPSLPPSSPQDEDVDNTVPLFEGDVSQSQRTPSPHPADDSGDKERGSCGWEGGREGGRNEGEKGGVWREGRDCLSEEKGTHSPRHMSLASSPKQLMVSMATNCWGYNQLHY